MTIRELARLAGVSHATVSRALRNNPRLSEATRERIQALARKHGYQPHPMVSKLMAQLPHVKSIARPTLAVVTSWPEWKQVPFTRAIYGGIHSRAEELGYSLEEFPVSDYGSSKRLSQVLYARGIEGIIIFPLARGSGHLSLDWSRFTSVAIGRSLARPPLHRVTVGNFENCLLALRHLRRLGYRRIAFATTTSLRRRVNDAYVAGYCLLQHDMPPTERIPIFDQPALDPAAVAHWLRRHRADALLCNDDPTPEMLRAQGLEIPRELGYASLECFHATEEVSGIDQHPADLGAAAVDLLTVQLHRHEVGIPPFPKLMLIQGSWVDGRTAVKKGTSHPRPPAEPGPTGSGDFSRLRPNRLSD